VLLELPQALSKTAKIYRSGTSPGYVDLELVTAALSKATAAFDADVYKASLGSSTSYLLN
jgi:hypothetical protein